MAFDAFTDAFTNVAGKFSYTLGEPNSARSAVFLNIVQKAFDPPPLRFEHHVAIFFDGFLKKRVNVCRDKIRQNNA